MKYELSRRIQDLDPQNKHWRRRDAIRLVVETIFLNGAEIGISVSPAVSDEVNLSRIDVTRERLTRKYNFFLSEYASVSDIVTDLLQMLNDSGVTITVMANEGVYEYQ